MFIIFLYKLTKFNYIKQVQRQAVASKLLSRKPKNFKTITPFKFTNLIWTVGFNNAQQFIDL